MQKPYFTRNLIKVCLDLQKEGHTIYFDDFYGHGDMPYIRIGDMRIWLVDLALNNDYEEHLVTRAPGILEEIIEEIKRCLEIQKEEFEPGERREH